MDVARTSAETAEKRKRNVEDVQKRSTYRRAHGLEDGNSQGLGGWTARSNEDSLGPALKVDAAVGSPTGVEANYSSDDEPESEAGGGDPKEGPYSNYWEGRRRPVKKWLGIWT